MLAIHLAVTWHKREITIWQSLGTREKSPQCSLNLFIWNSGIFLTQVPSQANEKFHMQLAPRASSMIAKAIPSLLQFQPPQFFLFFKPWFKCSIIHKTNTAFFSCIIVCEVLSSLIASELFKVGSKSTLILNPLCYSLNKEMDRWTNK